MECTARPLKQPRAQRKTEAHAVLLGREERTEQVFQDLVG